MQDDAMMQMRVTARTELDQVERQLAELSQRADALRQIISGVDTYLGMTNKQSGTEAVPSAAGSGVTRPAAGPRGREAVRAVLMEQPDVPMKIAAIAAKLDDRGWIESDNSVDATRTNLLRAKKTWPKNIERVGQGTYMWKSDENAEGPAATGPSELSHPLEEGDNDDRHHHRDRPAVGGPMG